MSIDLPTPDFDGTLPWLAGYRLVVFNAPGEGFRMVEIDAGDDAEALALCCWAAGFSAFELWDAHHMVARFGPKA